MVELVSVNTRGDEVVIEMDVASFTDRGAESRAVFNYLLRRPGHVTALKDSEVLSEGTKLPYGVRRVIVTLGRNDDLRSIIGVDEVINRLEG